MIVIFIGKRTFFIKITVVIGNISPLYAAFAM